MVSELALVTRMAAFREIGDRNGVAFTVALLGEAISITALM